MSYEFYKLLHLLSVLFLFTALGSLLVRATDAGGGVKRLASIVHGVSLVLILVAGFGLMARLGLTEGLPGWVIAKIVVWLLIGLAIVPIKRQPGWATALWVVLPILGGIAAWLAVAKPF